MRLFVAVDVPGELKERIERDVVNPLRSKLPGARWTRPEGRHLTLSFLGDVDEGRLPAISSALGSVASGARAFEVAFEGFGFFPGRPPSRRRGAKRPRVFWIGVGQGSTELVDLQRNVATAMEGVGFEGEKRKWSPHLTLARFPKPATAPAPLLAPLAESADLDIDVSGAFVVDRVVLFRSKLHPEGASYSVVKEFSFIP